MAKRRQPTLAETRADRSQRAAQARRQQAHAALARARGGRRSRWLSVGLPIAAVFVLLAVLVVVKVVTNGNSARSGKAATAASSTITSQVQTVPAGVLDAIGAGTAGTKPFTSLPTAVAGPALMKGGQPEVLYVGAEYCPYCAAERWALAVALSRFGSLHALSTTASSPSDVFPNTPTLSFHGASLTSSAVAFAPFEMYSNQAQGSGYAPLDSVPASDLALLQDLGHGAFPFIDIGGKYVVGGASYSPQLLANRTADQIAAALSQPTSPIAQAIDGTANAITAAICRVTGAQPAAVCTSAGVTAAAKDVHG